MNYKQTITKFISVILLFVFTQRIAGGLYFHNWLHSSKNPITASHESTSVSQYNCSCIDDFNIPFTEPEKISIQTPPVFSNNYIAIQVKELPVINKYFSSLRAPPVI